MPASLLAGGSSPVDAGGVSPLARGPSPIDTRGVVPVSVPSSAVQPTGLPAARGARGARGGARARRRVVLPRSLGHTAHCVMAQCSGSGRALCMLVIMFVPGLLTVLGTPRVHVGYNVYATLVKYVLSCYVFIPAQVKVARGGGGAHPDIAKGPTQGPFMKVNWKLDLGHQNFIINCAKASIDHGGSSRSSPDYVMNISSGSTKYWTPECEESMKPGLDNDSQVWKQALNSTQCIQL
nr:protein FAR1-RELATED SEQUENCE 5-like [Ipomoea trifida]